MHPGTICHLVILHSVNLFSVLFTVSSRNMQTFELDYSQGERGPSGEPGQPGDIGIGFPGAKVTHLYYNYYKNHNSK